MVNGTKFCTMTYISKCCLSSQKDRSRNYIKIIEWNFFQIITIWKIVTLENILENRIVLENRTFRKHSNGKSIQHADMQQFCGTTYADKSSAKKTLSCSS